ncbi:MAG: hypothetical protein DRH43_03200 [Deltaproteobacteria bacterium]|nr:MAG: hypothetical protein DRH43_03200 [Deltaproteobacteria bacterium]
MPEIIPDIQSKQIGGSPGFASMDRKLRKACGDFESIFIHYLLKSAQNALPESGIFDNRPESKIYKSMAYEAIARTIATGRGIGLGELLYERLRGDLKP